MAFINDEEDEEIAHNLWKHKRLLVPNTLNLRRWATFLRILFVVNLFVLPIELCFYHARVRARRASRRVSRPPRPPAARRARLTRHPPIVHAGV